MPPRKLSAILETCMYANDLELIESFYQEVLGLVPFSKREGRSVFFRFANSVLLYFNPETTEKVPVDVDGKRIPLHGTTGHGHVCFKCSQQEFPIWREWLQENGVKIEQEIEWADGVESIYFRDPAGNCLELASPELWGLPDQAFQTSSD